MIPLLWTAGCAITLAITAWQSRGRPMTTGDLVFQSALALGMTLGGLVMLAMAAAGP